MKPYFQRDNVTLFLGRTEDVLPTLDDGEFGLVFTSPPYNLGNSTGGGATYTGKGRRFRLGYVEQPEGGRNGNRTGKVARAGGYGYHGDNLPHDAYREWQQAILRECWRVTRDDGAIFYNHKPRILYGVERWPTEFVPEELPIRQTVIWHRGGGVNVRPLWYVSAYEVILVIAGPEFQLRDHVASAIGDVWEIGRETDNQGHPAPFPLGLPLRALETTGAKSVLDPFAGSGTTLLAAKLMGARGVGIEISEKYAEQAVRRLSQGVLALESVS